MEGWKIGRLGIWGRSGHPAIQSSSLPIITLIVAVALGLGLSAFFWLPAFGERDLIRLSGITTGFFDFRHNFISLRELLAPPRRLDLSAINPYYPLSLGLAQTLFAALALLALVLTCLLRLTSYVLRLTFHVSRFTFHAMGHTWFFGVALLVTVFLTLPYSRPVWEAVPLLELAEFPWRWLGPALLCAAILAGGFWYMVEGLAVRRPPPAADRWSLVAGRWPLVALVVALILVVAANLVYLFPTQFIPWGTPGPAEVVAYEAESGAIGTTSTGEFLPRWADRFPGPETLGPDYAAGRLPAVLDPASLPDGATAETLAHTARETRLAVSSPVPFAAAFRSLYWPDWRVLVEDAAGGDAQPISDVQVTHPEGLIQASLPAGDYQVRLRLFPTPIRRAAGFISALAVVGLVMVVGGLEGWMVGRLDGWKGGRMEDWESRKEAGSSSHPVIQPSNPPTLHPSFLPTFHALIIGASLIIALLVTRPLADWFRLNSPPDVVHGAQYAAMADFGDQVRLLAYDVGGWKIGRLEDWESGGGASFHPSILPSFRVTAGTSLPVVLYWRALEPLREDYRVFLHLDAPDGTTYASADELNPADIPTSHWPPSLYVREPLTLDLPADLPPMRYTLTAGLYHDTGDGARLPVTGWQGAPVAGGPPAVDAWPLAQVWVGSPQPPDEADIANRLDLRLGDHVQLLGYELTEADPAQLTLYWRAEAPLESEYTVFLHALDAGGARLAQFDAPPLDGLYPTQTWMPGQIIADTHTLALPESTRELAVGLYDPLSLARLPVTERGGGRIAEDAVRLQVAGSR